VARAFSAVPKDAENYSVILVDLDSTEPIEPSDAVNVYEISADFAVDTKNQLRYPPSLPKLRDIILCSEHTSSESGASVNEEKIIYIDSEKSAVLFEGETIELSEYEMRVLALLCERSPDAVSRAELTTLLSASDGNIADVYICHLRKKLSCGRDRVVIHTVRSKGYMTKYKALKILL
jgi:DNA-binding response OmpR family regulator